MKTKRIKKLDSGLCAVSLSVSEDVIRFALREAKRGEYLGPGDYLNAVLNTAMLREMEDEPITAEERKARRKVIDESEDGFPL